jgi:hypothetical protein
MLTSTNVPDVSRSDTTPVTTATTRYSLEDWRAAVAELDGCGGNEHLERATVLGRLMDEVRANARGGALPGQTRFVLALCDVYESRQRRRLGYATVSELADLVGAA